MRFPSTFRALLLAACVLALVAAPGIRAGAQDVEDLNVSRSKPIQGHDYASIPVNNSEAAAGLGTQVLLHRPAECRTATYCDVIDVNVDASGFSDRDAYELHIELAWENPEVNDLDLFIYDQEMGRRVTASATSGDPEAASVDRPPTGKIFVVVNNFSGPNLGYRVDVELEYTGRLKEIPKFERPEAAGPTFTPLPELTAAPSTPIKAPDQDLEPTATLAPVLTPGPDGALSKLALDAVEARAVAAAGGTAWWVVLLSVLLGIGVLGGTGFFIFRRVRRA